MEEQAVIAELDEIADLDPWNLLKQGNHRKETFVKSKDIFVHVKQRSRRGKCVGAPPRNEEFAVPLPSHNYAMISNDIWFHIADYVAPEEVLTFALLCTQTAAVVRTRKFWLQLYARYCAATTAWNLLLPEELQWQNLRGCDFLTLRPQVIRAFFLCYSPLAERLLRGSALDALLGHSYITSWHISCQCVWITCYKFWNRCPANTEAHPAGTNRRPTQVAHHWESLLTENCGEDSLEDNLSFAPNPHEGVSLLVIFCKRFIPFPTHLLYGREHIKHAAQHPRLAATRRPLTTDLRGSDLELDLIDSVSKAITTVKYENITKYKVLQWWHPDFRKLNK